MVLLRHLLGDVLRRRRQRQGKTLREVSTSAMVSLGYLSEIERGQKEASSELLVAICEALGTRMSDVMREVSESLALAEIAQQEGLDQVLEPVASSEVEASIAGSQLTGGGSTAVAARAGLAAKVPTKQIAVKMPEAGRVPRAPHVVVAA